MRSRDDSDFHFRVAREGDRAKVSIDAIGPDGRYRNGLRPVLKVVGPDQSASDPVQDWEATADRWIRGLGRTGYLWVDEGRPVSLAGAGGLTPNGIRIGPVYTPPELRGRGYASNLVAGVSQLQLYAGRVRLPVHGPREPHGGRSTGTSATSR
jgi:GNAT superfamily N-acetyltransferase